MQHEPPFLRDEDPAGRRLHHQAGGRDESRDQFVLGIVVDAQIRFHLGQQNGLDGGAFDLYRKHRSGILVMIKRLFAPSAAAVLAVALATASAQAIVGGAEDAGPLSRASVMVLSSNGGVCSAVSWLRTWF